MTPIKKNKGRRGACIAPHRRATRPQLDEERHNIDNAVVAALSAMRRASSHCSAFVADIFAHAVGPIECDPSADWSTALASLPYDASILVRCNRG